MNDGSDLTRAPQSGRLDLQPGGKGEQSARIVRLPDALENIARARRLEGEVVRTNQDGSTRIRTPEGDIDVKLRERNPPQPGQKVEIDLPAGRPPRQAVVRQAPEAKTKAQPQPQPQNTRPQPQEGRPLPQTARAQVPAPATTQTQAQTQAQTVPPAPSPAAPRPSGGQAPPAPQPLPLQQNTAPAPSSNLPRAPLESETVVRLLPVPPVQADQIVQQFSRTLEVLPGQVTRIPFLAGLIAQNAQSAPGKDLIQIGQHTRIEPLVQTLQPPAIPLLQTVEIINAQPPLPQSTARLIARILNLPAAQTSGQGYVQGPAVPQAAGSPLPAPSASVLTQIPPQAFSLPGAGSAGTLSLPASPASLLSSQAAPSVRIAQLDVQLSQVLPPNVILNKITPPGEALRLPVPATLKLPQVILTQARPATLTAQVTGFTPQNLPLVTLQWPGAPLPQSFVLQFNAGNLQLGSQIQLQPQNLTPAAPQNLQTGALPSLSNFLQSGQWPALEEVYQSLLQASPAAAQTMARMLPSPAIPAQLGPAALFFIAAVRAGDITSWMGERKTDLLQRLGKGALTNRLSQDISNLGRAGAEGTGSSSEWRATPLPLFWEGEIHKMALYVKQDSGNAGDGSETADKRQTRFIFDLTLSRMGEVQLDGLLRGKRLDLVVRTQNAFSASMQQALRQGYAKALSDTDIYGELSFQGDPRYWVRVLKGKEALGVEA